ncbi:MAG: response regulator transcription factor [Firmicutes bacterium]|nr:response regulator transcription factor [Alicyclobacillaceae bacterium]MCL6497608.1 response regulator transcription factor [Bacillota bacterium]
MRVLVVEDDPQVARVVRLALEREGFEVTVEESGGNGVAQALTGGYAVMILDLGLPDLDGIDVCRAVRAVSDTRILMLTARDAVEDRVTGLDAGADDYLIKPFAPQELVARVRALSRRPGNLAHADQPVTLGGWQVSPLRREVRVDGQVVELTRREFDLLWYLVQNPGVTLTRDMILDRVWGWSYGGGSNVVDVYIGYLRQKLPMGGKYPQIATVRGVGYSLKLPSDGEGC